MKTKGDLILAIAEELGLSRREAKKTVDAVLKKVVEFATAEGLRLPKFGSFVTKIRAARKMRNPRTKAEMFIPERRVVVFRPGLLFKNLE